jgi:predicted SnoaL-like aldol condensation-catalyzing enzyme
MKMMRHLQAAGLALAMAVAPMTPAMAATAAQEEANKTLVLAMWKGVIEDADEAAVMRYIAPDYIQHNTALPHGRAGLIEGVRRLKAGQAPHAPKTLVAAVAQGDLVVLVWTREVPDPADPKRTAKANRFDMFRVKGKLVVEHWDDATTAR